MSARRRQGWPSVAAGMAAAVAVAPWMVAIAQSAERGPVVTVDWIASGPCPDKAYVEAKIERLLVGATADAPRLRARAVVVRDKDGPWRVDLSTHSATITGHRSVTAETCRAAADVTALILALAVDPDGSGRDRPGSIDAGASMDAGPDSRSADDADESMDDGAYSMFAVTVPSASVATDAPSARGTAPSTSNETPTSAPDRPKSLTLAAGVYALGDLGTLPSLGPGGAIRLAAIPPFASAGRLELGASIWAPQTVGSTTSLHSRFDLRSFDVAVCWAPSLDRWELGACLGAELGWMTGSGFSSGPGQGETSDALWPILRPRATGAYRFSARWAVRADLGLGINLDRPQFRWEGVGGSEVESPAVVAARAAVGLEGRF